MESKADKNKALEAKAAKAKADETTKTVQTGLKNIAFTHKYTSKDQEDKPLKKVVVLTVGNSIFQTAQRQKKVNLDFIKANPVLAIKGDPRLARYTNATEEQVALISKTSKYELEKLI